MRVPAFRDVDVKRALIAGTAYFSALFGLGFVLGTIRVIFVVRRIGQVAATLTEVPVMLVAALFACRWTVARWQVPRALPANLISAAAAASVAARASAPHLRTHDMLMQHTGAAPAHSARPTVVWFDLLAPTPQELIDVELATGLHVPAPAELSEIESSSRLRVVGDALYLSAPLVYRAGAARIPGTSPVGFVLARDFLITIRYEPMTAFTLFAERVVAEPGIDGPSIFVALIDTIVDRMADVLETVGAELDIISQRVFNTQIRQVSRLRRPVNEDAGLRAILQRIGRAGDLTSRIRDGLLAIGRFIPFVSSARAAWFSPDLQRRLDTQRQDMASLADYDAHLVNKVQFLLDATMGLIGIEQNNVFKLLTVVSVIGIPPTLVAGMYGMNFKNMPEYDWAWGYQYGLLLIVLSAAIPWALFKLRGWL